MSITWHTGHCSHHQEADSEATVVFLEIFLEIFQCGLYRNNIWRFKAEANPDLVLTEPHCENASEDSCTFSLKRLWTLLKKAKNIAAAFLTPLKCHFLLFWKPSHSLAVCIKSVSTYTKLAGDSFLHTTSHHIFNDLLCILPRKERVLLNDTQAHETLKPFKTDLSWHEIWLPPRELLNFSKDDLQRHMFYGHCWALVEKANRFSQIFPHHLLAFHSPCSIKPRTEKPRSLF